MSKTKLTIQEAAEMVASHLNKPFSVSSIYYHRAKGTLKDAGRVDNSFVFEYDALQRLVHHLQTRYSVSTDTNTRRRVKSALAHSDFKSVTARLAVAALKRGETVLCDGERVLSLTYNSDRTYTVTLETATRKVWNNKLFEVVNA